MQQIVEHYWKFFQEGDDVNIGDTLGSIQLLDQELASKDKEEEKKLKTIMKIRNRFQK